MNPISRKIAAAAGILLSACLPPGCGPAQRPAILMDTRNIQPAADYSELAAILRQSVTREGLLIPRQAEKQAAGLQELLRRLAVTGPTVTPALVASRPEQLAYWYNARCAWSIKLAMVYSSETSSANVDAAEWADRLFQVDGRLMSLRQIDAQLEKLGGWTAVVAAPCACLQRAPLPTDIFSAADIDGYISRRLNAFIDNERRFVIDIEKQQVLVPPVLWRYRQQIINEYNSRYNTQGANLLTALLPYTEGSARRRLQDAIGYQAVQAPAERKLAIKTE